MSNSISSLKDLKSFFRSLILAIIEKANNQNRSDAAQIAELSSGLSKANVLIQELQVSSQGVADTAKLEATAKLIDELDTMSSELELEFNPTLGTDSLVNAIKENPTLEVSKEGFNPAINTNEPTPETVLQSSLDAIAAV